MIDSIQNFQTRPDGCLFGPTANQKWYLSANWHRTTFVGKTSSRKAGSHKSYWSEAIPRKDEYLIFFTSDLKRWLDSKGDYWGVKDMGNEELGDKGERVCKFPKVANASDPWHGYPTSPRHDGASGQPDDQLLKQWLKDHVVDRAFVKRIRRRLI
jgi:hypothetical protein